MSSVDDVAIAAAEFLQSHEEDLNSGQMEWEQALSGRSFSLSPISLEQQTRDDAAMGAVQPFSTLVLWGSADFSSYDNKMEGIDLDGDLFSAYIGVDIKPRPDLLTGLAVAMNRSGLDYIADDSEGDYTIKIISANPYVSWSPSDRVSIWLSAGYGRGTVERREQGEQGSVTDSSDWTSLSGGTRLQLWQAAAEGEAADSSTSLALKLDAATAQFMEMDAQQARLAGELSRAVSIPSGELTTAVELGVRLRSTEAAGLEVDGSLDWHNPAAGLSTTAHARVLLAGGDQKEWGVSGRLNYAPGIDGKGLTIALQPSIGLTNSRLADLWSLENAELAVSPNEPEARLKGELGYGFPAWSGLMTPYSDFSISEGGSHTIGMGMRYSRWSSGLEMDLQVEQRTSTTNTTDWSIGLEGRIEL